MATSTDPNTLRVAAIQWQPGPDPDSNLSDIAARIDHAAAAGATLVVFPEYSFRHVPSPSPEWTQQHTDLEGPWVASLSALARRANVTVVAGITETSPTDKPYNTQVVVDGTGVIGVYRKIHLYDAFSMTESALFSKAPVGPVNTVSLGGFLLGGQTCYDLRFPEVTRRLVDAGVHLVVMPSQWVPGPLKSDQWRTLVIARAIEAQAWMVAVDHPAPTGVGASMVVNPRGEVVAEAGVLEQTLIVDIDRAIVDRVRVENPMAKARRFQVGWG